MQAQVPSEKQMLAGALVQSSWQSVLTLRMKQPAGAVMAAAGDVRLSTMIGAVQPTAPTTAAPLIRVRRSMPRRSAAASANLESLCLRTSAPHPGHPGISRPRTARRLPHSARPRNRGPRSHHPD